MSGGLRIALRVAAVAVVVALTVAAVEGLAAIGLHYLEAEPEPPDSLRGSVRLHGRHTRTVPDPWLIFRLAPDVDTPHVHTNAFGLRGPAVSLVPEPDTLRMLLLGGSVAFGYSALDDSLALSGELERWLAARRDSVPALRGRRIEVLNGGVPSYVSWQSALAYSIYHRRLEPAVVISLDGANDISAAIRSGEAGVPMRWREVRSAYLGDEPGLVGWIGSWLVGRLTGMKIVELAQALSPAPLSALGPPPPAEVAAAYRRATVHLADAARGEGALAVAVLQPLAGVAGAKPLAPFERALVDHYERERPGTTAYYQATVEAIRASFGELARARPDLLLLDATGVYAGQTGIMFTDPTHLSQEGRRVLAAAIGERILARLAAQADRAPGP